jgi:hypothetical protein
LAELAKPADDEVELTAFGPGYGESLVIHLGMGEWMLVDSCIRAGRLPALDHLRSMGVDPNTAVKLLVATHWHDDHVRGIARAAAECGEALFVLSDALHQDELITGLAGVRPGMFGRVPSGVDELGEVVRHLERADELHRLAWGLVRRQLYRLLSPVGAEVIALSPCDKVVTETRRGIGSQLSSVHDDAPRPIPKPDRNEGAVVLWVHVGDASLLLGADLEETDDDETGWTAVVGSMKDDSRQGAGEVFKVPHHGSVNGHQELVWTKLLVEQPEAVVCPHVLGRNSLPTKEHLDLLCERSRVHMTAEPDRRSGSRQREGGPVALNFGRVTLRRRIGAGSRWEEHHEPPARRLCPA